MDPVDRMLLQSYQEDFPLTENPYQAIGNALGIDESEVIERYRKLKDEGLISRIGPLINPSKIGTSTLAAVSVPEEVVESTADFINGYREVNHNYLREHRYNLWFVVTAGNAERMRTVIDEIERHVGSDVLVLPMIKNFHIDLRFELWPSTPKN